MEKVVDYQKQYPERSRAVNRVRYAVKTGKLKRPGECEVCGRQGKVDGHHEDYNKPLDVMWLCRSCHLQLREKPKVTWREVKRQREKVFAEAENNVSI